MKKLGSIVLLVLYVFALYRPLAPLIDYAANYSYYSEILCINKDRPELACKGQCVLMQKIQQKAEKENPLKKIIINAEEEIPEILPKTIESSLVIDLFALDFPNIGVSPLEGHCSPFIPPPQLLS